ncbi:hypothetical protein FDG09_00940 [Clostridium sporogenes]|uniref:hypothetical protein n=1 Tax=Clostridium sporogenes TaxID=1509 RepID=UPI0013D7355E|nr:hypothetical protein [Clostridium sporogenes]NFV11530.1 hypothetical protein [Clostridium sporogenes]
MKKSKALIISSILGIIYSIYLIVYFSGAMSGSCSNAEAVGGAIATALVTPHMICVILAAIFNTLGALLNKSGFALTGGILYSVAGVLFIMYVFFVIPMIILSFVGYSRVRKRLAKSK